jgi:hypothetical protein
LKVDCCFVLLHAKELFRFSTKRFSCVEGGKQKYCRRCVTEKRVEEKRSESNKHVPPHHDDLVFSSISLVWACVRYIPSNEIQNPKNVVFKSNMSATKRDEFQNKHINLIC